MLRNDCLSVEIESFNTVVTGLQCHLDEFGSKLQVYWIEIVAMLDRDYSYVGSRLQLCWIETEVLLDRNC